MAKIKTRAKAALSKKQILDKNHFNHGWQKTVDFFADAAEAANVGIAIEVVGKLLPVVAVAGGNTLHMIALIADPMIYFFRDLGLLTKSIGVEFYDIVFEEDKFGAHQYQTQVNLLRMALFTAAIPLFFGLIINSPISLTIAWGLSLTSMCLGAHFNYAHSAKMSRQFADDLAMDPEATEEDILQANKEAKKISNSHLLYAALIMGIAFLSLSSSAVAFATPALVPLLVVTSKAASGFIAALNLGRLINACFTEALPEITLSKKSKPELALQSTAQFIAAGQEQGLHPSLTVDTELANSTHDKESQTTPTVFKRFFDVSAIDTSDPIPAEEQIPEADEDRSSTLCQAA